MKYNSSLRVSSYVTATKTFFEFVIVSREKIGIEMTQGMNAAHGNGACLFHQTEMTVAAVWCADIVLGFWDVLPGHGGSYSASYIS